MSEQADLSTGATMSLTNENIAHLNRAINGSEYIVPSMGEFVMTDNLSIDYPSSVVLPQQIDLVANVSVRESEHEAYLMLDVTTEGGVGAGLYLNREGALALIQALAQYATALA